MLFSNSIPMAIGLLVSNAMAMPMPLSTTAGVKCTTEGKVVCANKQFQTCASGTWSVSMALADGTDCSLFGQGAPVAPAAPAPSAAAPVPSAAAPVPSAAAPVTTPAAVTPTTAAVVPTTSADNGLGALQTTVSVASVPSVAPTTPVAPVSTPVPTTSAAPAPTSSTPATPSGGGNTTPGQFQNYAGPESSFPLPDKWLSYDALWDLNKAVCNMAGNDGKGDLINTDIQAAGHKYGVDARIVLAIVLQESTCQLSAVTTNGGVSNPGLMQSHDGVGYDGTDASIMQMMDDGTGGTLRLGPTLGGDGLMQLIKQYGTFAGLRVYNSGPLALNKANLSLSTYNGAPIGTASYCSDVANRLTGAKVAT